MFLTEGKLCRNSRECLKAELCKKRRREKGLSRREKPCTKEEKMKNNGGGRQHRWPWEKTRDCSSLTSRSDRRLCKRRKRVQCERNMVKKMSSSSSPRKKRKRTRWSVNDAAKTLCRLRRKAQKCRKKKPDGECRKLIKRKMKGEKLWKYKQLVLTWPDEKYTVCCTTHYRPLHTWLFKCSTYWETEEEDPQWPCCDVFVCMIPSHWMDGL